MHDKQIIDIARIKLPLVVEAITRANLEVQKQKPDLDLLDEHLSSDDLDGFYDVSDLLNARRSFQRIIAKEEDRRG